MQKRQQKIKRRRAREGGLITIKRQTRLQVFPFQVDDLWLLADNRVSASVYSVYLWIRANTDDETGNVYFNSVHTIAADLKMSNTTVYKAFFILEDLGLFKRIPTRGYVDGFLPYSVKAYAAQNEP